MARSQARRKEGRAAWTMLAPLSALYVVFFMLPILFAAFESLTTTQTSGLGLGEEVRSFAGLSNYLAVLSDSGIRDGFLRVFLIGIIQVPTMLVLATVLALLFDSGLVRAREFFQTSAFLPHAIPGVIAALVWGALYIPNISPVVSALESLSISVDFLGPGVVLFSIMNITTWNWTGYNMIILYTALQSIPRDVLESAKMDGASSLAVALRIKLPLIVPGLVITGVFSIIGSLQQFADPMVLSTISNHIDSRFTPNLAVYSLATGEGQPGMASALSIVVALIALVLSVGVLQIRDRTE